MPAGEKKKTPKLKNRTNIRFYFWKKNRKTGLRPLIWVCFLTCPFTICETSGKSIDVSVYQFPHFKNGSGSSHLTKQTQ